MADKRFASQLQRLERHRFDLGNCLLGELRHNLISRVSFGINRYTFLPTVAYPGGLGQDYPSWLLCYYYHASYAPHPTLA